MPMAELMQNFKLRLVVILFGIVLWCGGFITRPLCHAQSIDASGEVDQEYLRLNSDMTTYQIISKDRREDYMSYYRAIREKILAKLKRNYKRHYNDGDVHLFFVLERSGALVRIDVALSKSTKDTSLIDTALLSLQQAAPFGPFPEELKGAGDIPFSLVITFKKDNR